MPLNITYNIVTVLAFIICLNYILILIYLILGFRKIKYFITENITLNVKISVIIPFRNEKKNISNIINDLINQSEQAYEIIFIDDNSTDDSYELLSNLITNIKNIILIKNSSCEKGKKAALINGIQIAKGDWIIQTDADCRLKTNWIKAYKNFIYNNSSNVLIAGPVIYQSSKSPFTWFFELDFLSLVYSGAAFIGNNKAIYCNGANLAYKKSAINSINNLFNSKYSSGDDVFAMQNLSKKYPNKIAFIKNINAAVLTNSPDSLVSFFLQRIRWASKAKGYTSYYAKYIAISVMLVNTTILFIYTSLIFQNHKYTINLLIITIAVYALNAAILINASLFFKKNKLYPYILPALIIYPLYIFITSFASLFIKVKWKGRKIR